MRLAPRCAEGALHNARMTFKLGACLGSACRPAGGVRMLDGRRPPVVVADRTEHAGRVTSCLLIARRAGLTPGWCVSC